MIAKKKNLTLILEEAIFTKDFNLNKMNKFYQISQRKMQINNI